MTLSSTEGPQPIGTEPTSPLNDADLEKLQLEEQVAVNKGSVIKGLGWLDRFLAVWILLAMIIGVLLGNFVEETGPALQKGKFVGVSIPIAVGLLVLIWNGLAGGDDEYCAILVAVNSILQMVLYAPLAILFIRVISRDTGAVAVSYEQVATSVAVFLGIPLGAAIFTRLIVRKLADVEWYEKVFLKWLAPWSLVGLLYTILVLFASQGRQVVHQIVSVVRVAAPLIIYFIVVFFFTLFVCNKLGYGYKLGATQSFTAASNNFELAIAVAVATYGPDSDQALAATVGPLIEVPVLIGLVYIVRWMGSRWAWKSV
ncbi:arsenicals resistance [Didymella glomerata]|uniref:Arsenicals resistance n=1 Tax=Didymella glomerata TaxID=749621 RepID=A0A9W8WT71_9PLEO|nr:arsenicals resistance [Didymella glomerata]